ncbi:MAG: winged helix-turn-helix domain-containing protein [Chlamydiota bacterium]
MTEWLIKHGFTFKRPEKVPGKLDPESQAGFKEAYKELKKNLSPCDELCFLDAVHPEYQSQAVCGWIKRASVKRCKQQPSNIGYTLLDH